MLFFLPIGVQDAPASRLPVASLAIAAICLVAYFVQHANDARTDAALEAAGTELQEFWREHPYLTPPEGFARHFLGPATQAKFEQEAADWKATGRLPDEGTLAAEQAQLTALCESFVDTLDHTGWRRFALVPRRGAGQPGWITATFLHADFSHLFGNLLFFAIVAPVVEGVLGPIVFALFFLVGGVAAWAAQFGLDPTSPIPNLGASGAVAACMGAFTLRFARERVKFAYWVLFSRGTFTLPAWLAGGAWGLRELASVDLHHTGGGVAVMAHVGGFAFGLGVAVLLRALGLERHLVEPLRDDGTLWRRDPGLKRAADLFAVGDVLGARHEWQGVLSRDPHNLDALRGLATALVDSADRPGFTRDFEHFALRAFAERRDVEVQEILATRAALLDPEALRPAVLLRVGQMLEPVDAHRARALYEQLASRPVPQAARAALLAAEVCVATAHLEEARAWAAKACRDPQAGEDVAARARALLAAHPLGARFAGRTATGFAVTTEGAGPQAFGAPDVLHVAAGILTTWGPAWEAHSNVLVVELLIEVRGAPLALRFASHSMGLGSLYAAGTAPRQALAGLLAELLAGDRAHAWPSAEALRTLALPRFADLPAFSAARQAPAPAPANDRLA